MCVVGVGGVQGGSVSENQTHMGDTGAQLQVRTRGN